MTMIALRKAYGEALVKIGKKNLNVVVLDADLSCSTQTALFAKAFPERFFNMGVAEQDLMGTAAGFALMGKIPFASTFAIFATGRPWEMIRNSIAYPKLNVKIVATHAGITVGEDGASHQMVEDIAIMRAIPNMVVISPADAFETEKAVETILNYAGPVYLRLSRAKFPVLFDQAHHFEIGKGKILRQGKDITLIACGLMVSACLDAALRLEDRGIQATVVNMPTIKPLDHDLLLQIAGSNIPVFTVEEHSIIGGLGSAVCEVLSDKHPISIHRIGMEDEFGQSGPYEELLRRYGLSPEGIEARVLASLKNL